jgi:hypothetical protein
MNMKTVLKLEEAAMFALAVYLNSFLSYAGWIYWALFLTPDIGFAGYLFNARAGAFTYNLLHHKGLAILFYIAGVWLSVELLQFVGLLLFGHSSFDRMAGYGLKYVDDFHHTHLGFIGKNKR